MSNGIELPLLYGAAAAALTLTGPGAYSLDALLGLQALWTPALAWSALALGIIGGFGNLALSPALAEVGDRLSVFRMGGRAVAARRDDARRRRLRGS